MSESQEVEVSGYTLRRLRHKVAKDGRIDKAVEAEILALSEDQRVDLFRPSARCRICQTEGAVEVVNKMLSYGATHTDIMGVLEPLNLRRPKGEKITLNSIGHHARTHFPLEETANAVYRKLIEKRAAQYEIDFVNGVGGAVTSLGFLDVVVQKGLEGIMDGELKVSVESAIRAAKEVATIEAQRDQEDSDISEAWVQLNEIMEAVREEVPADVLDRIVTRLKQGQGDARVLDIAASDVQEVEEEWTEPGYDPGDPDLKDI